MPNDKDLCQCRIIHEGQVRQAKETALHRRDLEDLVQLFKAIGDPTRLKILLALDRTEMCVCDLAAYLEISESAVSHQLRLLRQLHLVSNRRDKSVLYYTLNDQHVSQLVGIALEHIKE